MKTATRLPLFVILSLIPLTAAGATRTWTGAGGNALWSNAANWDGGTAPKSGDALVFAGPSTTNDLTALSLASITVTAGAPVVSGNSVTAGAVHVTGGKLTLTGAPITGTANITVDGGTLVLDQTHFGGMTVNNRALEGTKGPHLSDATSLPHMPS